MTRQPMRQHWRALLGVLTFVAAVLWSGAALAHSSSNSYLTLSAPEGRLTLRADLHLRDVDLIFDLDADRDGQVSWGETQMRSAELGRWLDQGLQLSAAGQKCQLGVADLQASEHADGTYLSAQWTPDCPGISDLSSAPLTLRYGLMFDQDSLHRGLLKVDLPGFQSSALLSPERPEAQLSQADSSAWRVFGRYIVEGVWHIWIGIDHIVFLLSLLVLAPLQPSRQRITQWPAAQQARPVLIDVLAVVTAFTVAHSITLGLTILGWLTPPPDLVEPAIALSVVLAALNNLLGINSLKRWRLAFVFGLVHGFGFASVLLDLGLPASALVAALGGFNVGVELGQLAIVLVFLPIAWLLRRTRFYRWVVVAGGSTAIVVLGLVWTLERVGWLA
ncbi:HupE/UreJ family protein [Limnohabitans sp.]|uniref:HupE/UreJ family protein n=1 Tax=Limnohabitans sp. TaxID=1907725 RepID=UPI0025C36AD3|nr:HupE/UreJ family protein [Limnohabitans sp.]